VESRGCRGGGRSECGDLGGASLEGGRGRSKRSHSQPAIITTSNRPSASSFPLSLSCSLKLTTSSRVPSFVQDVSPIALAFGRLGQSVRALRAPRATAIRPDSATSRDSASLSKACRRINNIVQNLDNLIKRVDRLGAPPGFRSGVMGGGLGLGRGCASRRVDQRTAQFRAKPDTQQPRESITYWSA